jgi:LmbE family N-acetylglucosaminyl deacetylase
MSDHWRRPKRPPVGAVWGWFQTAAGRTATDFLIPGRALVLSPHQDDEVIGCGLLMVEKSKRGTPVAVAVATDGRRGWFSPTQRPTSRGIVEVRHHEWHQALDVLGVPQSDRIEFGFPDGELSGHENELVARITDLLQTMRPSQIFVTRPGDPHPDHRTLVRATRQAMDQTYGSGGSGRGATDDLGLRVVKRPQVFTYRVYPGEGLWPNGRPTRVSALAAVGQFARSAFGLTRQRPLLLRAPESAPRKATAIGAYESQRTLLGGELRFVWDTGVELYWPIDEGREDPPGPGEESA